MSTDAQNSSESVAVASEELSANVEKANSTSAEILNAMQQIASGAQVRAELKIKDQARGIQNQIQRVSVDTELSCITSFEEVEKAKKTTATDL